MEYNIPLVREVIEIEEIKRGRGREGALGLIDGHIKGVEN